MGVHEEGFVDCFCQFLRILRGVHFSSIILIISILRDCVSSLTKFIQTVCRVSSAVVGQPGSFLFLGPLGIEFETAAHLSSITLGMHILRFDSCTMTRVADDALGSESLDGATTCEEVSKTTWLFEYCRHSTSRDAEQVLHSWHMA